MGLAALQLGASESPLAIFAGPSDTSGKSETEKSGFAALLRGFFETSSHTTTKQKDASSNSAGASIPQLCETAAPANLAITVPVQIPPVIDIAGGTTSDASTDALLAELEGRQSPSPQANALPDASMATERAPAITTDATFSRVVVPEVSTSPQSLDQPSNQASISLNGDPRESIAPAAGAWSSISAATIRSESPHSLGLPASAQFSGKSNDGFAQSPGEPTRKNHPSGHDGTNAIPPGLQFFFPGSAPTVHAALVTPGLPVPHDHVEPLSQPQPSAIPVSSTDSKAALRDTFGASDFAMPASATEMSTAQFLHNDKALTTGSDSPAVLPSLPAPSPNPDSRPVIALLRVHMPAETKASIVPVSTASAQPTEPPALKPSGEKPQVQQTGPLLVVPATLSSLHLAAQEPAHPRGFPVVSSSPGAKAESNSVSASPWASGEDGGSNPPPRADALYQPQDKATARASEGVSHRDHDTKAAASASDLVRPESSPPSSIPVPARPYVQGEPATGISGTLGFVPAVASAARATPATSPDAPLASKPGTTSGLSEPPSPQLFSGDVHAARLVDGLQSEMHIGLHSSTFGSVEVHTVVRESQVGLTVGSEKGDLRSFLGAEMPALQSSLGQHQLRFDNVRFVTQPAHSGSAFSGFGDSHTRRDQPDRNAPQPRFFAPASAASEEAGKISAVTTGLNIHA